MLYIEPCSGRCGLNPLPHHPDFSRPCTRSLLKTLWEKEKMLVTSIFFFCHNVFYPSQNKFCFFQSWLFCRLQMFSIWTKFKVLSFGKELKPITTQCHILMHYRYIAVENTMRKEEIACSKEFLLFSQCFLHYMALIFHFKCTLKCCLQFVLIWTSLKFCPLVKI